MATGVLLKDDGIVGAVIKPEKKSFYLKEVFKGKIKGFERKGIILGLPLKDFFVKDVTLPQLSKKELQDAVKLQIASNLPYDASKAFTSYQVKKVQNGYRLFILATPKRDIAKPRAIFPEQLALYAIAMKQNLLEQGKKVLIAYITEDTVMTLATDGFDVVFMRSFKKDQNIITGLKLSAQAVYLREERTMLSVDRIVLFTEDDFDTERLKSAFSAEVMSIKTSTLIPDDKLKNDKVLIASGLALCEPLIKKLKGWNVYRSDVQYGQAIKRGLLYTLPFLPVFFTLYLKADVESLQSKINGTHGIIASMKQKYREVANLEREVTEMEGFLKTSGNDLISPESWFKTIKALEAARPFGLWFTTISGRTYSSVMINGKAEKYALVTEFIKNLINSEPLENVSLTFTNSSGEKGVDFQLTANMKSKKWV